jgi:hypothetical protein
MVEDEKVKKWLEEQEKIKSELSILAGSLKGTGHNYKDDKAQKIEDTILQDAKLKEEMPNNMPPKAPEEVYVAKEFKFPEKKDEPPTSPVVEVKDVATEPQVVPPKLKPTTPIPVTPAPTTVPAAHKVQPVQQQSRPSKVLSPTPPTGTQPPKGAQPVGIEAEFAEIISYIEEKIGKTPDYINFNKARELLEKAIKLIGEKNTTEALRFAKESQKEVKRVRLKYLRTKKLMKQVKGQMKEIKKKGIDINVQRGLLSQANTALENNDFQNAMNLVKSCMEENAKNL